MELFQDFERPYVSGEYILRNDNEYVIAYENTVEENRYLVLPPITALVLPLFDGTNTIKEIKYYLCDLLRSAYNGHINDEIIDNAIESIISSKLMTINGEKCHSLERVEKLVPDIANYKFPIMRLNKPLSVAISFSNRCKFDCVYCYAERKKCIEKEVEQWSKIFDELESNGISLVDIGGADIFSRSDAMSLLTQMVERDFVFLLSTKSFIDKKCAQELAEMEIGVADVPKHLVRHVQLSIDSINDALASYLVKKTNHYESTRQSVSNLMDAGIKPRIKCVLTSYNVYGLESIIQKFAEMGVEDFQFVQYSRSHYRHDDSLFLSKKQKEFIYNFAISTGEKYPDLTINVQKDLSTGGIRNLSGDGWKNRAICSGGRSSMTIQPNGDVTLCEQVPHEELFIVGNVFEEGVLGVWNSQRVLDFTYPPRDTFKGTACYDCQEFIECHGIKGYCYSDVLSSYGTIYDAQPECPLQTKMPVREI
jgi:radical SAM protein with 4Fe4S-binding SPASM domain